MQTGRAIASALNVVQTAYSYGDFMLFAKAAELKQVAYYFYLITIFSFVSSLLSSYLLDTTEETLLTCSLI